MNRIATQRIIAAPVALVFRTVGDIREYSRAVPKIVNVEFLSESRVGLGTRFRETRITKGKEAKTELEVTEFIAPERIRIVADSHGCVWDSVFTVRPHEGKALLTLVMDARPYKLLPRLLNPLLKGMITKALEADMDMVQGFCEAQDS